MQRIARVQLHDGSEIVLRQSAPDAPVVIDINDPLPGDELGDKGRFEVKLAIGSKSSDDCLNVSRQFILF